MMNKAALFDLLESSIGGWAPPGFIARLISYIDQHISTKKNSIEISAILQNYDYRFIADLINARKFHDNQRLKYLLNECASNLSRQIIDSQRFSDSVSRQVHQCKFSKVRTLSELFESKGTDTVFIFAYETAYTDTVIRSLEDVFLLAGGSSEGWFRRLLDLRGTNSLVRQGLVKTTVLMPCGEIVVKKNNPAKLLRFQNEQASIIELKARTGLSDTYKNILVNHPTVYVGMLRYLAVASSSDQEHYYSVSEKIHAQTLEDHLLTIDDIETRKILLMDVRSILEWLYERGVVWGDMAPRNILLDIQDECRTYTLLDFEKTTFTAGPVCFSDRVQHLRGPVCIEEFGAVCSLEEVEFCFHPYFVPHSWDTTSISNIGCANPKWEYLQILEKRGESLSSGNYNRLELEIMSIRFPYWDLRAKQRVYPLHIGYRIDHYFGRECDSLTTQTLMIARQLGGFENIVNFLNNALNELDKSLLLDEFHSIASGKAFSRERILSNFKCIPEFVEQASQQKTSEGLTKIMQIAAANLHVE
jgi:serine/threonine protein kinase